MTVPIPVDPNLVITGYIRPNQQVIFRELAKRVNMPYVNLDTLIAERPDSRLFWRNPPQSHRDRNH